MATDAVVGGRFGLPRTIRDLDAAVLTKAMGTTVRSARILASDAGTSSRARLVLTGTDVPDSVFVKEDLRRAVAALDDLETIAALQSSM